MAAELGLGSIDYKKFLAELKKAGDKFPFLWKIALDVIQKAQEGYNLMLPTTPVPTPEKLMAVSTRGMMLTTFRSQKIDHIPIDAETVTEEKHLASLLNTPTSRALRMSESDEGMRALGDGTFLRFIFAFLEANPQLLTLILSLFGVKMPGGIQV